MSVATQLLSQGIPSIDIAMSESGSEQTKADKKRFVVLMSPRVRGH
jgi:hypothetical protein